MPGHADPHWKTLRGGYRIPYDPTPSLCSLEEHGDSPEAREELWGERKNIALI